MKNVIKVLALSVLRLISYTVVTTLDIVMWAVALLNKGMRLLYVAIDGIVDRDWDGGDLGKMVNFSVNFSYKAMVDKLYPTEEDEDEP